eukprot:923063_1
MGRKKDPVWRHFTEVPPADGANQRVPRMKCNYCDYNQAFNSTRANRHIYDVCANVPPPPQAANRELRPEPAELEIGIDEAGRPVERPALDQPEAENEHKNAENAAPRPSRVQQVGRFFDSMSDSERTKLDAMFARAVFATGTAFFTHANWPGMDLELSGAWGPWRPSSRCHGSIQLVQGQIGGFRKPSSLGAQRHQPAIRVVEKHWVSHAGIATRRDGRSFAAGLVCRRRTGSVCSRVYPR